MLAGTLRLQLDRSTSRVPASVLRYRTFEAYPGPLVGILQSFDRRSRNALSLRPMPRRFAFRSRRAERKVLARRPCYLTEGCPAEAQGGVAALDSRPEDPL